MVRNIKSISKEKQLQRKPTGYIEHPGGIPIVEACKWVKWKYDEICAKREGKHVPINSEAAKDIELRASVVAMRLPAENALERGDTNALISPGERIDDPVTNVRPFPMERLAQGKRSEPLSEDHFRDNPAGTGSSKDFEGSIMTSKWSSQSTVGSSQGKPSRYDTQATTPEPPEAPLVKDPKEKARRKKEMKGWSEVKRGKAKATSF